MTATDVVRVGVLGTGGRGAAAYGRWVVEHPHLARLVAVADPDRARRDDLVAAGNVPNAGVHDDWRQLLDAVTPGGIDAIVIALPDALHEAALTAALRLDVPVLMEKPVVTSAAAVERIDHAVRVASGRVTVAHVLRAAPFWRAVRRLLDDGVLGDLVTVRHEENIGFWHFAHSYVRGNWRRSDESSPMILSKTCHDLDLITWLVGATPVRVSSSGGLRHFTAAAAPPGAPARCTDGCPHADSCPFFAPRYYVDALGPGDWRLSLLGADRSTEGRLAALRTGPYGRCVYHCDNDVVDHQQTLLEYADGVTAVLSTSAFTGQNTRFVHLTGTRGQLEGRMDTGVIELDVFAPDATVPVPPTARLVGEAAAGPLGHRRLRLEAAPEGTAGREGHGGGDDLLTAAFVDAVARDAPVGDPVWTFDEALVSHRIAFAAEQDRLAGQRRADP